MFLDSEEEVQKHGEKLPHWQQGEVMQFVTFRLKDAMPKSKLSEWKEERETWLSRHPKPWDDVTEGKFHERFTRQLERWLDQGHGSCLLRDEHCRLVLSECLMRFQGERVVHESWVIMPNHVHLLFVPKSPLEDLLKAWKGVSSRSIGRGQIWQKGYRDTLIRDSDHYVNAVRYIRRNPEGLRNGEYLLWEGERALGVR